MALEPQRSPTITKPIQLGLGLGLGLAPTSGWRQVEGRDRTATQAARVAHHATAGALALAEERSPGGRQTLPFDPGLQT